MVGDIVGIKLPETLKIELAKHFDKGEIDKIYEKLYKVAHNAALKDLGNVPLPFPDTFRRRIDFHLEKMFQLTELWVKLRTKNSQ